MEQTQNQESGGGEGVVGGGRGFVSPLVTTGAPGTYNDGALLYSSQPQSQLVAYQNTFNGSSGQIQNNYHTNPPHESPGPGSNKFKPGIIASAVMNVLLFFLLIISIAYFFMIQVVYLRRVGEPRDEKYDSAYAVTNGGFSVTGPLMLLCLYVSYYDCVLSCGSAITPGKLKAWIILTLIIILLSFLQIIFLMVTLFDLHPTDDVIIAQVLRTNRKGSEVNPDNIIQLYDALYGSALASAITEIIMFVIRGLIVGYILLARKSGSGMSTDPAYGVGVTSAGPITDPHQQEQQTGVPSSVNVYEPSYPPPPQSEDASTGTVPVV